MSNVIVVGTQWGDEGKGKIVDLLTEKSDLIVRFQGGNNAGHTLVVGDKKVILHCRTGARSARVRNTTGPRPCSGTGAAWMS